MTSPDEDAAARYRREYPTFAEAADAVEGTLRQLCRAQHVPADVKVRAKSVVSFLKKIHIKGYRDPWTQITDKVGARITVATRKDMATMRRVFEDGQSGLDVLSIEDKAEQAGPETLFYPGVHVQVQVPDLTTEDGQSLECEIQLRTKAQDLWSVPSHELIYKGVIDADWATKRRVLRLSVLVEMFDEEVIRAMDEIAADPRYALGTLLRRIEPLFVADFESEPGEDDLSLELLDAIRGALPPLEGDTYAESVAQFASLRHDKIQRVLEEYGAESPFEDEWLYWMFTQPEVLVVLERIENAPMLLADAVRGTDVQSAVERVFAAWGEAMPES